MPEMDVTLQWSLLYQGLLHHSKATLLRGRLVPDTACINLYGHNAQRQPEIRRIKRFRFRRGHDGEKVG